MEEFNLWALFETLARVFITVAVGGFLAMNVSRDITIIMVILFVWTFYPAGRFIFYRIKEIINANRQSRK